MSAHSIQAEFPAARGASRQPHRDGPARRGLTASRLLLLGTLLSVGQVLRSVQPAKAASGSSPNFQIEFSTLDGGGGEASAAQLVHHASCAQRYRPGEGASTSFRLTGGVLASLADLDTPTPTPTATPTETPTATATATLTDTATATQTASPSSTSTETATPSRTATRTATQTPSATPTSTATATTTVTGTATRTATPSTTATPALTGTATATPISPIEPPFVLIVVTCPGSQTGPPCARLQWAPPALYDSFTVERAPDSVAGPPPPQSSFVPVATGLTAFEYDDLSIPAPGTYWYQVRTVLGSLVSAPTSPPQPVLLRTVVSSYPLVGELSVPGRALATVVFPVNINNAFGLSPEAGNINLVYDPDVLEFDHVENTYLTAGLSLLANPVVDQDGDRVLLIGFLSTGAEPLAGRGHLVDVVFRVKPDPPLVGGKAAVPFRFKSVRLFQEVDGQAVPIALDFSGQWDLSLRPPGQAAFHRGDLDGNAETEITAGDALQALLDSSRGVVPTELKLGAGDINGEGSINAGDAISLLRLSVGLPVNPSVSSREQLRILRRDRTLRLPRVVWQGESEVSVPVVLDETEGVSGLDLQLSFDPTVLRYMRSSQGPAAAAMSVQEHAGSGVVRFSMSATQGLGPGQDQELVVLTFGVEAEELRRRGSTPLVLAQGLLHAEFGNDLSWTSTVRLQDGQLVSAQSQVPAAGLAPLAALVAALGLLGAAARRPGRRYGG